MKKIYLNLLFLVCLSFSSAAQDSFDEDFFRENLLKKTYSIDSEAEAVILYEKGSVNIELYGHTYKQEYTIHRIIKILKNSAKKLGDISEVYHYDDNSANIEKIKGTTYNLEGDKIVETDLDRSAVSDKKVGKRFREMEFAMPAVREGCIIDYEFKIMTPLYKDLPTWEFQGRTPKIISEFELTSPAKFDFNSLKQGLGIQEFKKYNSVKEADRDNAASYMVLSPGFGVSYNALWCAKNLEALKQEPFISSIENYRQLLEIQILRYNNTELTSSWKSFNQEWWDDEHFGKQVKKANNFLNEIVDSLTKNLSSPKEKAAAIFDYARTFFDCSNLYGINVQHDLSDVFGNKRGTGSEINLLLTAMLRKAGLNASPVILSTLGHLRAIEEYPFIDRFNYTVCEVRIDDKPYLLDATNKYNPFGILPSYCYNGYARVIDKEGSALFLTSRNISDKNYCTITVSGITDTSISVYVSDMLGAIDGIITRNKLDKDSSYLKEYVNNQVRSIEGDVSISNISVQNLNEPEKFLGIKYALKVKKQIQGNVTYMPTDIIKFFSNNPFTAMQRHLPIEFRSQYDYTYSMNIFLPAGMTPEESPKTVESKVDDSLMEYKHIILYDSAKNMLSVNSSFKVNETYYPVASYNQIRSFFERIIKEENSVFVLKKKI